MPVRKHIGTSKDSNEKRRNSLNALVMRGNLIAVSCIANRIREFMEPS